MTIPDFSDLNHYVSAIKDLTANFYETKVDVIPVDKEQITTHVTASDLNIIKQALSTLCENVNKINSHLVNSSGVNEDDGDQNDHPSINDDLNKYLANEYVRKNQITVDGDILNDSPVNLDQLYLQTKNIFVDGYKVSHNSAYNLVSLNQLTVKLNNITAGIDDTLNNILNQLSLQITSAVRNIDGIYVGDINIGGITLDGGLTTYSVNNSNTIDITIPLQSIINSEENHINVVWNDLIARDTANYVLLSNADTQNYYHQRTVQNNEWAYGVRLLANGWAPLNSNVILDPQYRQFKWFRVYSNISNGSNKNGMVLNFDPTFHNSFIGNNFPVSASINSETKDSFSPTEQHQFDIYHNVISGYYFPKTCSGPTSPTSELVSYDNKTDRIYNGWNRGWMECGGQQRVYAWKDGNFIRFKPSSILFPLPFDKGFPIDIQVTLKRDVCQPFPYIIPISVVNEDIYYFDIVGGGQGVTNTTTGFFYLKWEAKGMFLHNNIINYYYMKQGYNTIQDIYNITNWNINPHYSIDKDISVEAGFTTQETFRAHTKLEYVSLLYKDVLRPALLNILTSSTTPPNDTDDMSAIVKDSRYNFSSLANQYWHDSMDIMNNLVTTERPRPKLYQTNILTRCLEDTTLPITGHTTYKMLKEENTCRDDFKNYIYACLADIWPTTYNIREYWLTHSSSVPSSYFELTNKIVLSTAQLFEYGKSDGWEKYEQSQPMVKEVELQPYSNLIYHIFVKNNSNNTYSLESVVYNPSTSTYVYTKNNSTLTLSTETKKYPGTEEVTLKYTLVDGVKINLDYKYNSTTSAYYYSYTTTDNEEHIVDSSQCYDRQFYFETATKDDDILRLRRDAVANKPDLEWKRYNLNETATAEEGKKVWSEDLTTTISVENGDYWKFKDDTIS